MIGTNIRNTLTFTGALDTDVFRCCSSTDIGTSRFDIWTSKLSRSKLKCWWANCIVVLLNDEEKAETRPQTSLKWKNKVQNHCTCYLLFTENYHNLSASQALARLTKIIKHPSKIVKYRQEINIIVGIETRPSMKMQVFVFAWAQSRFLWFCHWPRSFGQVLRLSETWLFVK